MKQYLSGYSTEKVSAPSRNKGEMIMRESGILMHITSLPGPWGIGTVGKLAYDFVDFLEAAGQSYWQILPLTPTGYGDSPYQSFSACAGNHYLIDLDTLCMGHPVFELGSMFNAYVGFSEVNHQNIMNFLGISFETAGRFWNMALKAYLGTDDEAVCQSVAQKAMIIGYTRILRRAIRRPDEKESPARIARCKEMLGILLNKVDSLEF
jgi:hypothetical protein